jgi:hypothetical protein
MLDRGHLIICLAAWVIHSCSMNSASNQQIAAIIVLSSTAHNTKTFNSVKILWTYISYLVKENWFALKHSSLHSVNPGIKSSIGVGAEQENGDINREGITNVVTNI